MQWKITFFPDLNDRTKNDPATIVSSKQVIEIYNQLNKDGNEIQRITSDVKDWFVKEAIDNYGWDEAKFIGNQCIYEEIETTYNELQGELSASEDAMYPNGRDYDSESFD